MFQLPQQLNVNDVSHPLQWLEDADFTFILTGSRRFGDHHEHSDYDFFVHDEVMVREWLDEHGFKVVNKHPSYALITDCDVFRKQNVDVQVRKNIEEFERMNQWLEGHPEFYRRLKLSRNNENEGLKTYRLLWQMVQLAVR